jgi:hypothetical protein
MAEQHWRPKDAFYGRGGSANALVAPAVHSTAEGFRFQPCMRCARPLGACRGSRSPIWRRMVAIGRRTATTSAVPRTLSASSEEDAVSIDHRSLHRSWRPAFPIWLWIGAVFEVVWAVLGFMGVGNPNPGSPWVALGCAIALGAIASALTLWLRAAERKARW